MGDASGKGVDAAARTAEVKSAVRAFMTEYPYPARTLMRVNEFLCSILRLREETQTFVTLALVVMDPVSGEVLCASAGNEPPLLVRADGQTAAVPVGGMPLGLYPDAEYEVISERILPNDTLLLTTDGLTETRREQEFLGFEGFARLAAQARSSPTLAEMGRSILEEARAFAGGTFRDDVCLLLAQLK